eukprot:SAG31_NODE_18483_length_634_cov_1.579439_1_plen_82_part_10
MHAPVPPPRAPASMGMPPDTFKTLTFLKNIRRPRHRTVCKMIGFQEFWRFKAIYFSIGAFFVNILGGKLAPFNSKEIRRFTF